MKNAQYLYQRLRDMREDFDMKQSDIAKHLNITAQQYQLYESGKRQIPLNLIVELAKLYKVSLDYLAGLSPTFKSLPYDAEVTSEERKLLSAYSTAPENIKAAIRALLGVDTGSSSGKVIMNNININN